MYLQIFRELAMRKLTLFILLGISSCVISFSQSEEHQLTIEINNIKEARGKVMVAIYADKEHYLDSEYAIPAEALVTESGSLTITVNIPFGDYAIGAFHDINENGELDTNGVGIPNEPYGFSNGRKGTFGPPSFNKAKFQFSQQGQIHQIKL